jgi:hypothetical protein
MRPLPVRAMSSQPDPERLADATRRAVFSSEQSAGSNQDGNRVLALDVLVEFAGDFDDGNREQLAWALLWAENAADLEPHEERIREDAWKRINDPASALCERSIGIGLVVQVKADGCSHGEE